MSFPPRPPVGMPPMAPGGMMPRYHGYTPMGMMPMGMGMMPMMPQPAGIPPTTTAAGPVNRNQKKLVPQEIPKKSQAEDKPPVTTVFVGNISERAPDAMIRQMLQRCGNVLSWKRVQGASGKLQAFGFCEYEDPEATLRCIRLLNEWKIADKTLVVKVDAKTKALLDEYKRKKRHKAADDKKKENKPEEDGKDSDKEQGEIVDEDKPSDEEASDELDEFCQREDRVAKAGLDAIMKEYAHDLAKVPPPEMTVEQKRDKRREKKDKEKSDKEPGLDDMELGEEELSLINREIKSFRDAHKEDEVQQREREREREREARRRCEEEWERERERERELRERELRRERERERERREREYSRRTRSRSRERTRERTRERSMSRELDPEDEEEAYERRKLERKIREKEAAYQELLMKWEARERKKAREYEKEREREEERRLEEAREARRLKEFLEDYDDERDDPKYYKGSALQRRLKEREKEMEADERDRQREKEELEEIRKKLEEEGHPDIEAEMARIEKERDEHLMPRLQLTDDSDDSDVVETSDPAKENMVDYNSAVRHEPSKHENARLEAAKVREDSCGFDQKMHATLKPIDSNSMTSVSSAEAGCGIILPSGAMSEDTTQESTSWSQSASATQEEKVNSRIGFGGLKIGAMDSPDAQQQKRKKLTVGEVFNQDEDEEKMSKKHRLVPLDYSEEERTALIMPSKPTTAEEKRKCIKNLIERIPTGKEELFAYRLDWKQVDQVLMDKRIKPWVNKKIIEYIGEEEPTLTEFICSKVMAHSAPHNILNDLVMVLDEEAEVFVVKMWRLLIYETEAKKLGLVK